MVIGNTFGTQSIVVVSQGTLAMEHSNGCRLIDALEQPVKARTALSVASTAAKFLMPDKTTVR